MVAYRGDEVSVPFQLATALRVNPHPPSLLSTWASSEGVRTLAARPSHDKQSTMSILSYRAMQKSVL